MEDEGGEKKRRRKPLISVQVDKRLGLPGREDGRIRKTDGRAASLVSVTRQAEWQGPKRHRGERERWN